MSLLFGHDHKFRLINGKIYSIGGLSNEVLERYVNIYGNITVVARIVCEKVYQNKYSEIKNSNIKIINRKDITRKELEQLINESNHIIVRLPSMIGNEIAKYALKYNKSYLTEVVASPFDSFWHHSFKGKIAAIPITFLTRLYVRKASFALYVTEKYLQNKFPCDGISFGCTDAVIEKRNSYKTIFSKNKIILGTIGALDVKYKGQQYVIKALYLLKKKGLIDYEYRLIGNGKIDRLQKLIKKYKLNDEIKIIGGVSHDKIFSEIDNLDIYIHPSLIEGLPRSLLEAMSCGIPCIASSVGGIPELLEPKYLFKPKDYKKIAFFLENLNGDWLIKNAKSSYINSLKYDSNKLTNERNVFYKKYLDEVNK